MSKNSFVKQYRFPGNPDEEIFFAAKAAAAASKEGFGEFVIKAVIERTQRVKAFASDNKGQFIRMYSDKNGEEKGAHIKGSEPSTSKNILSQGVNHGSSDND